MTDTNNEAPAPTAAERVKTQAKAAVEGHLVGNRASLKRQIAVLEAAEGHLARLREELLETEAALSELGWEDPEEAQKRRNAEQQKLADQHAARKTAKPEGFSVEERQALESIRG